MEDMRSLGSRCRGRDEVCEINGSKVVKRGEASEGEVPRTCRMAVEDSGPIVCFCMNTFGLDFH